MQTKPSIQKQINQVKIWLSNGLTTEKIIEKMADAGGDWRLSVRTVERRIQEAKDSLPDPSKSDESIKVDKQVLSEAERAKNELTEARTRAQNFLTATINEIVDYAEKLKKENPKDLSYLQVFKTASKSGFSFEKILPLIRLEEGLPNTISKQENQQLDKDGKPIDPFKLVKFIKGPIDV